MWNWWSGNYDENVGFKPGMNTATMEHYIDFASKNHVEYMMIDAGWAARGSGPNSSEADITEAQPNINMPGDYCDTPNPKASKHLAVDALVRMHRQMEEAFALFEKWGVPA